MDHAQNITKQNIQANINKEEDHLIYLKRNFNAPDEYPQIGAYDVLICFQNYVKRLQHKIEEIRDHCKNNRLEDALLMQNDLMNFC